MKVALVCDWLTSVGGGEKVLLELHRMYPDAPIYTSQYDPKKIDWFVDADVRTGKLQNLPVKLRRLIGPLRQWYFSHLDLSEYDLVISVTGAEAKAVKVPNGVHVCYCHVPTQYYWQMYDAYIKNPGFGLLNPLVRLIFRLVAGPLRRADLKAAQRPDYIVTISEYAQEMMKKYYGREATIIHPPVEVEEFGARKKQSEGIRNLKRQGRVPVARGDGSARRGPKTAFSDAYYITTSRQVNWKRIDLAVKACLMTQRHLLVIGDGPEHKKLVKLAKYSGLVKFLPVMKKEKLVGYLSGAKGYLFPSFEPFGIAPVEALAAGCPIIVYGQGGARDYLIEGKNGIAFDEQSAKSLAEAILKYEKMEFKQSEVVKSAEKFAAKRFDEEIKRFIKKHGKENRAKAK